MSWYKLFVIGTLAATVGGLSVFHGSFPHFGGVSDAIFIFGLTLMVIVTVRTLGWLLYGSLHNQVRDMRAHLDRRDSDNKHDWGRE